MVAQAPGQVRLQHNAHHHKCDILKGILLPVILLAVISQSGCSGVASASGSTPAILGLNPSVTSLNFGNVNMGGSSTLAVTFTNTTSSTVTVSGVSISGSGFAAGGLSNGATLSPGASVALNVTFTPGTLGLASGTITITDNASNPTLTIALSGTGSTGHIATVSWNASSSTNVNRYNVYRGVTTGGPYPWIATVQNTSSVDGTVQSGRTYYYVVTAVDAGGLESSYSNEAPAVIP